jgi:hypothetical protein
MARCLIRHKNKFIYLHLEEQDPLGDRSYDEGSTYRGKEERNGSKGSNRVVVVVVVVVAAAAAAAADDDDDDEQLYLTGL